MNIFDDQETFYLNLSFKAHGRTHTLEGEYGDDTVWSEILNDIVQHLESVYGYSFDLPDLGMHYTGKGKDE